jgi:hypothetical protein
MFVAQDSKGLSNGFNNHLWGDPPTETMSPNVDLGLAGLDVYQERRDDAANQLYGFAVGSISYFFNKGRLVRVDVSFDISEDSGLRDLLPKLTQAWGEPSYNEVCLHMLRKNPDIDRLDLTSEWSSQDGSTEASLSFSGKCPILTFTEKKNYKRAIDKYWHEES